MNELKAIRSGEIYNIIEYEDCYRTDDLYYPKSEADKVIAELETNLSEIQSQKMQLEDDVALLRRNNAELKEEHRWRKCSEELPTENDANESGKVLGYLGGYKIAHEYHWTDVRDKLYGITHWMPMPKAPEEVK